MFSQYAQSSDVPTVGLTVRQVTCTDARNRGSGHTQTKEFLSFFQIHIASTFFES
jgi:hypothetical protein